MTTKDFINAFNEANQEQRIKLLEQHKGLEQENEVMVSSYNKGAVLSYHFYALSGLRAGFWGARFVDGALELIGAFRLYPSGQQTLNSFMKVCPKKEIVEHFTQEFVLAFNNAVPEQFADN